MKNIMLLSILGLSWTDLVPLITTVGGGIFGWIKWLQADKEKHKATLEADAEKHKRNIESDKDREKVRVDAEVEKERIKTQGEVDKARERSVGAEAVVKIWKEMDEINEEMKRLTEAQSRETMDASLFKETLKELKDSYGRLTHQLFEIFQAIKS